MSLQLVSQGLTDAVMFKADGETVQPAEVFYKKAILVERGSFRPVTYATNDMLDGARRVFLKHCDCSENEIVVLMEMTLDNLRADGELDHADFSCSRRYSSCAGANSPDLEIRRILSTRRVSLSLHKQSDRPCHGSAQFDRNLERKLLYEPGGRHPGGAGQNV